MTDVKTVVEGTDFTGNDLATKIEKALTVQECCKFCAADPECRWFQISTDPSEPDLCWLKSVKGAETNTQPRYGAAVAASFAADPTYCPISARAGWGWSFLVVCALAVIAYAGLGVARTGKVHVSRTRIAPPARTRIACTSCRTRSYGRRCTRWCLWCVVVF